MSSNNIVHTLGLMCDKNNPQDAKLLLLAELVETKCEALGKTQGELKESLKETNSKLDKLTQLLESYERTQKYCPVQVHKKGFSKLVMFMEHPKITILVLVGVVALLMGVFGAELSNLIRHLVGL